MSDNERHDGEGDELLRPRKKNQGAQSVGSGTSGTRRRNAPPLSSWLHGDIEGGKGVTAREMANFADVAFYNEPYTALLKQPGSLGDLQGQTEPERMRNGSRVVWVEHLKTGEMVPLILRPGMAVSSSAAAGDSPIDRNDNSINDAPSNGGGKTIDYSSLFPQPLSGGGASGDADPRFQSIDTSHADVVSFVRTIFLFVQGLFAGFTFAPIYLQQAASSDEAMLVNYQPSAEEYRRLCYLLATISLVGSIDALMILISNKGLFNNSRQGGGGTTRNNNRSEFSSSKKGVSFFGRCCRALGDERGIFTFFMMLALVFYTITFLSTIVMSRVDVLIAVRGGFPSIITVTTTSSLGVTTSTQSTTEWATKMLASSSFRSDFQIWKSLNKVRVVCAVLAWVCCCFLIWRDLTAVETKNQELDRLREAVGAWRHRAALLEGNEGLEELDITSMRKLVAIMQIGLDRAQSALRSHPQSQDGLDPIPSPVDYPIPGSGLGPGLKQQSPRGSIAGGGNVDHNITNNNNSSNNITGVTDVSSQPLLAGSRPLAGQ